MRSMIIALLLFTTAANAAEIDGSYTSNLGNKLRISGSSCTYNGTGSVGRYSGEVSRSGTVTGLGGGRYRFSGCVSYPQPCSYASGRFDCGTRIWTRTGGAPQVAEAKKPVPKKENQQTAKSDPAPAKSKTADVPSKSDSAQPLTQLPPPSDKSTAPSDKAPLSPAQAVDVPFPASRTQAGVVSVPEPPRAPQIKVPDRFARLWEGPAGDLIVVFNTSASAPNLNKNLQGRLEFADGRGSVCFPSKDRIAPSMSFYTQDRLRQLGLEKPTIVSNCPGDRFAATSDVQVLVRGELRKAAPEAIEALFETLARTNIQDVEIFAVTAFEADTAARNVVRDQIRLEVNSGARDGFGYILVPGGKQTVCISDAKGPVHAQLVQQSTPQLARAFLNWEGFATAETSAEAAFISAKRDLCGVIYAPASTLAKLALAFERDHKDYDYLETWISIADVKALEAAAGSADAERKLKEEQARQRYAVDQVLNSAREKALGEDLRKQTEVLRARNRSRVVGLTEKTKASWDAFIAGRDDGFSKLFPAIAKWHLDRKLEGWELTSTEIEPDDYGRSEWRGRQLETLYAKITLHVRNRAVGEYRDQCWMISYQVDEEFQMLRSSRQTECQRKDLNSWKQEVGFKSDWTAGQTN